MRNLFFYLLIFFSTLYSFATPNKEKKNIKTTEEKYLKNEKKSAQNITKTTKKIISDEKKAGQVLKEKTNFIKLNPPSSEYFSEIFLPDSITQLDEKITESIKYGAQALIVITWEANSFNNSLYISQVLQGFSESESLINSYRTVIASVQIDSTDLIEVPITLGMPNPPTNDWCVSISACILPKNPLEKGKSYFGFNTNPPLTGAKILMTNTDIMQGNFTNQTCGEKKSDPCFATNIKLTTDLPNKITQAIQAYVSSIPLYPVEYSESLAKSAKKGFNEINKTVLDRINTKTNQAKNHTVYSQTTYNETDVTNTTKPKRGFINKMTFGVL